jgi:hypothetical protein
MAAELRKIDRCSACEAPIVWASTSTGKSMPVDAAPVPNGNILLFPTVDAGRYVALVLGKVAAVSADRERYTSHFATCRYADLFRPRKLHKSTGKR